MVAPKMGLKPKARPFWACRVRTPLGSLKNAADKFVMRGEGMKRRHLVCAWTLLCLAMPQAQAWGLGVRAGTQGVGADVGFPLSESWSLRLGASVMKWDRGVNVTDVRYDGQLRLENVSALVEWHPIGPFRVSAGIVPTRNRIQVRGEPIQTIYRINGTTYDADELRDLRGELRTGRSVAPYLGVGYGIVAKRGVNLYADLGAMWQGSPRASLAASCGPTITQTRCLQLQSDVRAEQRQLADNVRNFKWFPVVNLGVTIGF